MKKWINGWLSRQKSEKGAVVVEASISLTVFMFFIVTILSIVNISAAQAKIGLALNATAKEISQYSYLYSLTGLDAVQSENFEGTAETRVSIDNVLGGITTMYNSLGTVKDVGSTMGDSADIGQDFETIIDELNSTNASAEQVYNELSNIAGNPQSYIIGAAKLGLNEITDAAKSKLIAGPLTKIFIQKHLRSSAAESCETYLKRLGIVPKGSYLNGIDFSESVIFLNGSDNIILVADYEIEVIKLLNHEIKLHFVQSAATKAWSATPIGSDLPTSGQTPEAPNDSGPNGEEDLLPQNNTEGRPSWQQSEDDIEAEYPDFERQKSFVDGVEVAYGTSGSVRPDLYKAGENGKPGTSIDVKNYDVVSEQGKSSLVSNIKKQYYERVDNLPKVTNQIVIIDVRGQNISKEDMAALRERIMKATNNGIEVKFKMN